MIKIAPLDIDHGVRTLCRRPYPGHPNGCPNYGKRNTCPPEAHFLENVLDLGRTVWILWVDFNLEEQRGRMLSKHPGWSKRQAECCLYWQAGVRKELREEMQAFIDFADDTLMMVEAPEAYGVNVTETMSRVGIQLEWPPEKIVRKVGLIGWRAEQR